LTAASKATTTANGNRSLVNSWCTDRCVTFLGFFYPLGAPTTVYDLFGVQEALHAAARSPRVGDADINDEFGFRALDVDAYQERMTKSQFTCTESMSSSISKQLFNFLLD